MPKIFCNGSSGFIGSHFVEKYYPTTFGYKAEHHPCFLALMGTSLLKEILAPADIIIHLEAYGANNNDPIHLESIKKLQRVIECMPTEAKLIFISSASVYDSIHQHTRTVTSSETDIVKNPKTLYLQSKLICENLVRHQCKKYMILRLSNVVGPNMRHGVIANIMNHPLDQIFEMGTGWPGPSRSFIDIIDVVNIIYELSVRNIGNRIINVANLDNEFIRKLAELAGLKTKFTSQPMFEGCSNIYPSVKELEKLELLPSLDSRHSALKYMMMMDPNRTWDI